MLNNYGVGYKLFHMQRIGDKIGINWTEKKKKKEGSIQKWQTHKNKNWKLSKLKFGSLMLRFRNHYTPQIRVTVLIISKLSLNNSG